MRNLLLIGLPGSGKSYFGRKIADELSTDFIDLDQVIVSRKGKSIEEIFASLGEEGFRDLETEALKSIENKEGIVLATGGGAVLRKENRLILDKLGVTVFLDRDPEKILADVSLADRPLLKNKPERLRELHDQRFPIYMECADFLVDSNRTRSQVMGSLKKIWELGEKELDLAVIGDPIDHSLSPEIHKAILGKFLKNISYGKIRIEKGKLQGAFDQGHLELDGFNVTMPHKADIIPFLLDIDSKAKAMNSVNTVLASKGGLKGYSTDGDGISMAIENMGGNFKGSHVMIFGSGGAAKVVAWEAREKGGSKIEVFSRTPREIHLDNVDVLGYDELFNREVNGNILINASPQGMEGVKNLLEDYSFLDKMKDKPIVLDMVYHPATTLLIEEARKRKIKASNGLDMLIGQAVWADNKYLNLEPGASLGIKKAYRRARNDNSNKT